MKKIIAALLFLTLTTINAHGPEVPPIATTTHWLIVGGTRGIGYTLADKLTQKENVSCTLFVHDGKKAHSLFDTAPYAPTIIEGAVSDLARLREAAAQASYIVIAGSFPYAVWAENFQAMVINCIAIAQETNATLIYYGRTQRYGLVNPITESSIPQPNSEQGIILDAMQKLLEECTTRTIIIQHGYPFGPRVGDGLLEKAFTEIPNNKNKSWFQSKQKFQWIGSNTAPVQFAYLPNLADATFQIVDDLATRPGHGCITINFAGITVENIDEFGRTYAAIAQVPYELELFSHKMLSLMAPFKSEIKQALDAYDSFTQPSLLTPTTQYAFSITPLQQALEETYTAYAAIK